MARNPRFLTASEEKCLLDFSDASTPVGVSVRVMLMAGLRLQEVCGLTRSDLRRACVSGLLSVRKEIAKYKTPRTIPVCLTLARCFASWLNSIPDEGQRSVVLWPESMRTVQRRLAAHFDQLGIRCTPHDLRHTFACALYLQCGDLSLVQACLGHRNLRTTLIYVHIDGVIQGMIQRAYIDFRDLPARQRYSTLLKPVRLVPKSDSDGGALQVEDGAGEEEGVSC